MDWDDIYEQEQRAGASNNNSFFTSASSTTLGSGGGGGGGALGDMDVDLPPPRGARPSGGGASSSTAGGGSGSGGGADASGGGSRGRRSREAVAQMEEEEEAFRQTPLGQLTRHWVNERHAPDILPAQEELLGGLLDHLRVQTRNVQILRDDPSTSESEHIRIMLVQTEIERVKFIVRSYIRTRLYKIEKYARYITHNAEVQTRLTASEREHASRHAKLTDQHLYHSVLQSLPEAQAHLDDTPVFYPSMVTAPDKTRPIFVHALTDCPPVRLPDGIALEMKRGHISLTPYAVVEALVERGDVELV